MSPGLEGNQTPDDEDWNNFDPKFPDWALIVDTESTWWSIMDDNAVDSSEFRDQVSRSETLEASSAGHDAGQTEQLVSEPHQGHPPETDASEKTTTIAVDCHCLGRSACLLDQLHVPGNQRWRMDQLIDSYRSSSQVLHKLYDCSGCSTRSEVLMIIVMILQRMLAICEQMVDRQVSGTGSENCELRFGQISVTTIVERNCLSYAFISAQCRDFATLLGMFKTRAGPMPGSLALLQSMESRRLLKLESRMALDCSVYSSNGFSSCM